MAVFTLFSTTTNLRWFKLPFLQGSQTILIATILVCITLVWTHSTVHEFRTSTDDGANLFWAVLNMKMGFLDDQFFSFVACVRYALHDSFLESRQLFHEVNVFATSLTCVLLMATHALWLTFAKYTNLHHSSPCFPGILKYYNVILLLSIDSSLFLLQSKLMKLRIYDCTQNIEPYSFLLVGKSETYYLHIIFMTNGIVQIPVVKQHCVYFCFIHCKSCCYLLLAFLILLFFPW